MAHLRRKEMSYLIFMMSCPGRLEVGYLEFSCNKKTVKIPVETEEWK
uniref:Uncharacterized protein n=1 Tax=Candidatus Kentrum sp. LFY TaxID=2126342 RepID=A0A450UB69_9GAMM|nr:MAG: hypothetical protein BECKLFY1418B_GA0070995_101513 [Candidatus Kentron sp. LFY]